MAETLPEVTVEGSPTPAAPPPVQAVPAPEQGHSYFVDADGQLGTVPDANAQAAQEAGFRPATRAEVYAHQQGAVGQLGAASFGLLRGATLGGSDPAALAIDEAINGKADAEEMRQHMALMREAYPGTSMATEMGGSLAPLALGLPPAAAAAEGASTLARAGAIGARLALEGAALGTGEQLTEDTLGNHDLSAQKYLAAAVKGGLMNIIVGAGLHGVGSVVGKALEGGAGSAAVRATEEEAGKVGYKSFGTRLADTAEEQAAKSMLPASTLSGAERNALGRTAEEQATRMREIGRTAIEEGIVTPTATKEVMSKRVVAKVEQVGRDLGDIRASLEKSAVRPSAENVINRVRGVAEEVIAQPFSAPDQRALAPFIEELEKRTPLTVGPDGNVLPTRPNFNSFAELHELRAALDTRLDSMRVWEKFNGAAPGHEALKQIRGILEDEYERAAGAAANDLGEDVLTKYRTTKALYQDLKQIEKWTTKGAAREAQHRAVSLTDTIAAGAGLVTGHALGGLAVGAANKAMRTYGNQAAASLADRVSKLWGIQRAGQQFDRRLSRAVEGFFSGKRGPRPPPTKAVSPETARALRQAIQNPAALTERVSDVVAGSGLHDAAPKVAQAMTNAIMRAAVYLNQRMPPEPQPAGFHFGTPQPRALGPYAQSKLDATVGALDVEGVLSDIENGRADRQRIEALRIIHPEAHAAIVKALLDHGVETRADLTHQQEVAMSILTGQPVGAIMQPKTIRGFQEAHATAEPATGPGPSDMHPQAVGQGSPPPKGNAGSAFMSGTQRLETNGI